MKHELIEFTAVRSLVWRVSRKLYFWSRRDLPNAPQSNGEYWLLNQIVNSNTQGNVVLFDIGANKGDWSHEASELLKSKNLNGVIYAFEPTESTFSYLSDRFKTDSHIKPNRIALSNQSSQKDFFVVEAMSGINTLIKIDGATVESVKALTVDDFLKEHKLDKVSFIKCDTEGHDFIVLSGAEETLANGRVDVWQFEYNHRWVEQGSFLRDVFKFINGKPYTLGKLCPDEIECYVQWHPELERFIEGNYVLIRKGSAFEKLCKPMHFDASNVAIPN